MKGSVWPKRYCLEEVSWVQNRRGSLPSLISFNSHRFICHHSRSSWSNNLFTYMHSHYFQSFQEICALPYSVPKNILPSDLHLLKLRDNCLLICPISTSITIWRYFSSVQYSCSVVSDSLRHCGPQHTRPPCPSPTPRVHPNPRPSSRWCHPAISSSVVPFSSWPQFFPASGSFPMNQLFASGGQSIGVSASTSVLMNI